LKYLSRKGKNKKMRGCETEAKREKQMNKMRGYIGHGEKPCPSRRI